MVGDRGTYGTSDCAEEDCIGILRSRQGFVCEGGVVGVDRALSGSSVSV